MSVTIFNLYRVTFSKSNLRPLLVFRIVPLAMERAIREIISPVVDRSVTIACMTTRELVTKVVSLFIVTVLVPYLCINVYISYNFSTSCYVGLCNGR